MTNALFDLPGRSARGPVSIQERFEDWVARNPEVVSLYIRFALDLKSKGKTQYGIAAITERIRWHYAVERDTSEEFRINNNYRSRMARLVMQRCPELDGFFEVRDLRSN